MQLFAYLEQDVRARVFLYPINPNPNPNPKESEEDESYSYQEMVEEKRQVLEAFKGMLSLTECAWLIGTSNLIVGLDIAKIKRVVMWGGFYSKLDLLQAAGRAGREGAGEVSVCTVVDSLINLLGHGYYDTCLRQSAESCCDFDAGVCLARPVEPCLFCRELLSNHSGSVSSLPNSTCANGGSEIIQANHQELALLFAKIQQFFAPNSFWRNNCLIHTLAGGLDTNQGFGHNHMNCPKVQSTCNRCWRLGEHDCTVGLLWIDGTCQFCAMPSKIGEGWMHTGLDFGGSECPLAEMGVGRLLFLTLSMIRVRFQDQFLPRMVIEMDSGVERAKVSYVGWLCSRDERLGVPMAVLALAYLIDRSMGG
jgi:hypothetical protein